MNTKDSMNQTKREPESTYQTILEKLNPHAPEYQIYSNDPQVLKILKRRTKYTRLNWEVFRPDTGPLHQTFGATFTTPQTAKNALQRITGVHPVKVGPGLRYFFDTSGKSATINKAA